MSEYYFNNFSGQPSNILQENGDDGDMLTPKGFGGLKVNVVVEQADQDESFDQDMLKESIAVHVRDALNLTHREHHQKSRSTNQQSLSLAANNNKLMATTVGPSNILDASTGSYSRMLHNQSAFVDSKYKNRKQHLLRMTKFKNMDI